MHRMESWNSMSWRKSQALCLTFRKSPLTIRYLDIDHHTRFSHLCNKLIPREWGAIQYPNPATTDRVSQVKRLPPQSPATPSTTQRQHPTPSPSHPSHLLFPDHLSQNSYAPPRGNVCTQMALFSLEAPSASSPSGTACTSHPPPAPGSVLALAETRRQCPLPSAVMGDR